MKSSLLYSLFLLVFAAALSAQTPASVEDTIPQAKVRSVTKIDPGDLLFAIRIYASKSEILYLSEELTKEQKKAQVRDKERDDDPSPPPFSLNGSTLTDVLTGQVYPNRPMLPTTPFVGPMEILTSVNPGGWIQMGIAFPLPPPPPLKDGKTQPYQLVFRVPKLKIETPIELDPDTLQPLSAKSKPQ